jgi:hypothetical protein
MKKLTLLLLGLLVSMHVSADVLIWKQSLTTTTTGLGRVTTTAATGWMVMDPDRGGVTVVKVYKSRKRYTVEPLDYYSIRYPSGKMGKSQMVLSLPAQGDGIFTARGTASTADLYPFGDAWNIAKTMTISGSDSYTEDDEDYLKVWSGTYTYDSKATSDANFHSRGLGEAVDALIVSLTGKGYAEE